PRWLRRVLLRGLATTPGDRFPALDRLLAALRADPRATRFRVARYAAVFTIIGAALFGWRAQHEKHAQACRGAEKRLAGIWDSDTKSRVRSAFLASGAPYAENTYAKVSDILDRYATQWVKTRTDACEATQIRAEQSAQLMDLRMQCLDRRAAKLSA